MPHLLRRFAAMNLQIWIIASVDWFITMFSAGRGSAYAMRVEQAELQDAPGVMHIITLCIQHMRDQGIHSVG